MVTRVWKSGRCLPYLRSLASDVGVALGQSVPSAGLPQCNVKTLGRLLAQPGALNTVDYEAAVFLAMAQVENMDGKDCIRVLGALAQVSRKPDPGSLQALGAQLSERLGDISSNDMAELAENLAVVSAPVAPVFARLSSAFTRRVSAANPKQLTKVASAFARARLADRRLMPRLAQGALKQLHLFSPQDLSAFMSSFAALGLCHEPLLTGSAKVVVQFGPRLSAMDLALVAFSYAQFFLVFPTVVSLLEERLPNCAHELPKDRLAELIVSCARLMVKPTELMVTFARELEMSGLSDELFGQVSKSVSALGLATAPSIQQQLEQECQKRLKFSQPMSESIDGNPWWILDMLESLGGAAEESKKSHSGQIASFWHSTYQQLSPALLTLIPNLNPTEAATLYRSLRQLPASVVNSDGQLHDQLALRCLALATVEAFEFLMLTSVVYSQLCLYPEICLSELPASNPSWTTIRSSWKATFEAWKRLASGQEPQDMTLRCQVAVLRLALGSSSETGWRESSRHRPVALELQQYIRAAGCVVEGPIWEGPFEIHAVTTDVSFCLMPEDAYFKKLAGSFRSADGVLEEDKLELCHERHAQMYLLNREGSRRVVPIAFETWRKCTSSQRQGKIQDILQVGKWEQRSPQKHINARKKGRHAASWGRSRIGFASRHLDLPRS